MVLEIAGLESRSGLKMGDFHCENFAVKDDGLCEAG